MTKETNKKILVRDGTGARKSGLSFTILKIICAIITLLAVTSYLQVFFFTGRDLPQTDGECFKEFPVKEDDFYEERYTTIQI